MKKPKLMVIGNAEHGKDTLTEMLCDELHLDWASSSWVACELFIYDALKGEYGYKSSMECWLDRRRSPEMRARWAEEITAFNRTNITNMGRIIFERYQIYNGIRNYDECLALKKEGLYDFAIGIDASGRLPLEGSKSMDQSLFGLCDWIVTNNGTLEDLENFVNFGLIPTIKKAFNA